MTSEFHEKIYKQLKRVPKGRVTTYKDLADSLNTKAYRAVGTAMKNNPYAPIVPCHRVVKSDGSIGGFSGKKGVSGKIKLLKQEGILVNKGKVVDFEKKKFKF